MLTAGGMSVCERIKDMKTFSLSGCGTALVTPFKGEEVDYEAFASLVDRQVKAGVHFLVPLGTTGETPCLDEEEKIRLLEITREHSGGLPVLAGVGTNSLKATLRNMSLLEGHGLDAFLIVVPYYNKPTQEGQYRYFRALAESTDKPLVIYNVPGRTGANMTAETTLKLAEFDNVVAIKEASSDYAQISKVIKYAPEGFVVLSGNDDETLSLMATGAKGVVSVASNIAPELVVRMVEAAGRGDFPVARQLHHRLSPLFKNCFIESNPIPVKAALSAMGLMENSLRLPLVCSSEATYKLMKETVTDLGLM